MSLDIVVVPSTIALLPEYAGAVDPVAELRAACRESVSWLVDRQPAGVNVLAAPARPDNVGRGVPEGAGRVGRHLLAEAGFAGVVGPGARGVLVVANGTATRGEKAPGHLDERSFAFDAAVEAALRDGDSAALRDLDTRLGADLWCFDVLALQRLGELASGSVAATMTYADDPFGVRYWVARWECGS